MEESKHPKPNAKPNGCEVMQLMTAALQAADELGIDSVAVVREVLEAEGFCSKKGDENEDH